MQAHLTPRPSLAGSAPHRIHHRIFQLEDLEATCVSETAPMGDRCACKETWLQR